MIYTGGDGDDKMMGMGRGWRRTNGDGVGMGAAPMGRCGEGERIVGMGMKFITVSLSSVILILMLRRREIAYEFVTLLRDRRDLHQSMSGLNANFHKLC